ncbi:tripartite tricarboxylate transporter substrate binding protein [Roseomonas eburnea]|uniref:Tripartite tricarboxylate transporter substrate binding protein n=1 Tax=Neoroseomonas eburnea TaxID=1346889 RepID=A0A9X9XEF1_9PROT|nr:tripartite tricarboxylate transporter substrate binding protein [Neoroseomonas eburnea]MBR0682087.1 tripartite tricarboxylate transporter substrate binding protein [Neoroseomonas eburnea]
MRGIGRRTFLAAALGAPAVARAQDAAWPARPVTVVTGYAAGGLSDVVARAVAERMAADLGQPVVVENRTGAAASIAAAHVVRARPDGYTLLLGTSTLAINPTLQPSLPPQDPLRELAPVAQTYDTPFVLLVNAELPARDLAGFLAYARARPGEVMVAHSGTGSVNHLLTEMVQRAAGLRFGQVPYRGAPPALLDLKAGRVQATFATLSDAQPQLEDGRLRLLAVSSRERIAAIPAVPTVQETLPGVHAAFWQAMFAPAGTPAPVIARLAASLRAATGAPEFRALWGPRGVVIASGGPEELRRMLASEIESWGRLIREAGIRAD